MICPHCKKPVQWNVTDEAIKRAKKLQRDGYSLRDIAALLTQEGYQVSFSSIARHLRRLKKNAQPRSESSDE